MLVPHFDRKGGEWIEPDKFCGLFDLGGRVGGSSTSTASQQASVSYIPSVFDAAASPPLVSSYPAGQGLATLNTAYPSSFANAGPQAAPAMAAATASGSTLLILAAIGLAAYYFLRKKK